MTHAALDPLVGVTFGRRWRIERPLAAGGMGAVYVASDVTRSSSHERVALKLIKGARADDAQLVARFRREMRALAAVRHDNVVAFLDGGLEERGAHHGRRDDVLYLVMELLDGSSLRALCAAWAHAAQRLEWQRAFTLVADVCAGLGALHDAGIVHRDLKPENVFVASPSSASERAVLIDLGIVRLDDTAGTALRDVAGAMTQTGTVVGTPGFIAPEQLRGRPATPASDVYAAGVMLFELLTGRLPYDGANLEELMRAQVLTDALPARKVAPWLPEHVDALLARMLAREPARRIATAHEARALLIELLAAVAPTESFTATVWPAVTPPTSPLVVEKAAATTTSPPPPLALAPAPSMRSARSAKGPATAPSSPSLSTSLSSSLSTSLSTSLDERGAPLTLVALAAVLGAAIAVAGVAAFTVKTRAAIVPAEEPAEVPAEVPAQARAEVRTPRVDASGGIEAGEARAAEGVPETGTLHVDARPAADVIIDDVPRGRTPLDVELTPGVHVVKLVGPAALGVIRERAVNVVAGETVRLVEQMPTARSVTASTLRALAARRAADLAPCGRPAWPASARMTALPDGKVLVVVEGPRGPCVMARTVSWRVDAFEGSPVTAHVDVILGE